MLKTVLRRASYVVALLSSVILLRVQSEWTILLLPLKLAVTSLSPILAAAGFVLARIGLARKDAKIVTAGLIGGGISAWYVARVTAPHDGFEKTFGADWQNRIPADLWNRLLPRHYTFWPFNPPEVPWQADLEIGTHVETGDPILADLWQPPPGVPRTGMAVIYLHGSAWYYLKKDFFTRRFFRHLARQGHVILDVAYTMAPHAQIREMLADVKRAIAWTKANAERLGINPDRIVLMGGSAGAHLALLAAYTPNRADLNPADITGDTSVRAVVSYYGPGDLRLAYHHLSVRYGRFGHKRSHLDRWMLLISGLVSRMIGFMPEDSPSMGPRYLIPGAFGGAPYEVPELYRLGSPITHIGPQCPPTLLFQGAHDFGIDVTQGRRLSARLREVNVPSIYVEFPYTEHVFDLFFSDWAPAFQAATYDTERFLALML